MCVRNDAVRGEACCVSGNDKKMVWEEHVGIFLEERRTFPRSLRVEHVFTSGTDSLVPFDHDEGLHCPFGRGYADACGARNYLITLRCSGVLSR